MCFVWFNSWRWKLYFYLSNNLDFFQIVRYDKKGIFALRSSLLRWRSTPQQYFGINRNSYMFLNGGWRVVLRTTKGQKTFFSHDFEYDWKSLNFHCGIKFLERILLSILILLNQKRAKNRMKLFVAVGAIATPTLAGECAFACTAEVLQSNIVNTGSRFVFVI